MRILLVLFMFVVTANGAVDFEHDIVPILTGRCLECHDGENGKGGLDLSTRSAALKGGESGPALVAGRPSESYLLERIELGEMPPESRGQTQKLPAKEIEVLREWIHQGAVWPKGRKISLYEKTSNVRGGMDWWSLQPVRRPTLPAGIKESPIDHFVHDRLRAKGMSRAPRADRRTLIRRAYSDVLGLPPTMEAIERFVQDGSDQAWETVVDLLLASPHYGERWARHWLDVVRFAETSGYERDQLKPGIWKYRDWVIKALNEDMPYDRFITLQLAGDEVEGRDASTVVATGMIRAGTWNDEPNDPADYVYERLQDMVHATSTAFLGLTVKCARCHDHKFDPIPQEDYYRMVSYFWPGYIGQGNLGGPSSAELGFDLFGWTDRSSKADPVRLLIKGNRLRPGRVIEPGFLTALPDLDRSLDPPLKDSRTTQRRLQFSKWLTDPANPLTPRVMVNRIWLHHFGEGLVRTPNNFGFKGATPSHPELLDYLAAEFVSPQLGGNAWSMKHLHKLILMSETYCQDSNHPNYSELEEKDFQNRLLWKFNRRRMDAEQLRDSLLVTSGRLNRSVGGESFYPRMSSEALEGLSRKSGAWKESSQSERSRRSIYMMTKRSRILPLMTAFDFNDTTVPCGRRDVTTVAPQALALMNNHFVHEQSRAFAARVRRESGEDLSDQVKNAWRFALGRVPTELELRKGVSHLKEQQARFENIAVGRDEKTRDDLEVRKELALWLRADRGVELDEMGRVRFWRDGSAVSALLPSDASQADSKRRPLLVADAFHGRPALRFDGVGNYMHLVGQVLTGDRFTIFAVATQNGKGGGHREILSNWNRRGRSTSSIFLGTTGTTGVRLSDAFSQAGQLTQPDRPFVLGALTGDDETLVFQNRRVIGKTGVLAKRDVTGPYVIGTQGDYGSEWWHGELAELLVYRRALGESERDAVWDYLETRYGIEMAGQPDDPGQQALASLCHVLMNSNEFVYID